MGPKPLVKAVGGRKQTRFELEVTLLEFEEARFALGQDDPFV
jgi:hypothetical protein